VAQADTVDDDVPAWVWWVLAAVLVALAALAWVLLARSRRRRAWREQLQAAEAELAWMARELLPQLRATGSVEGVAGGWQVGLPRVTAAEDQLTVLESSAGDDADRARAHGLREAVRTARAKVEGLTTEGPHDTWMQDLDDAIATLEGALAPPQPAETPR
jgi:hypothetical protein